MLSGSSADGRGRAASLTAGSGRTIGGYVSLLGVRGG